MALNKLAPRIAIVRTRVIGASWAAESLAHGFDVVATDPPPNAEQNLWKYIDAAWPALAALEKNASRERLTFSLDLKRDGLACGSCSGNSPDRAGFQDQIVPERTCSRIVLRALK